MVSRGLKRTTPLRSALPDVFLRKNAFEERLLQSKQKVLEKAERKVIDRLAREQEEFAILNCVHFRNDPDKFKNEIHRDNVGSLTWDRKQNSSVKDVKTLRYIDESHESNGGSCKFGRSKSKILRLNAHGGLPENFVTDISTEKQMWSGEKPTGLSHKAIEWKKRVLRPRLSLPARIELKQDLKSGGDRMRAKSAPVKRTEVTFFSGKDGRVMSLTPVVRHFSSISLNEASNSTSRTKLSSSRACFVKTLSDMPKNVQAQLKSSVYFLSKHKIKQQAEMVKIRTKRALSAGTLVENCTS